MDDVLETGTSARVIIKDKLRQHFRVKLSEKT